MQNGMRLWISPLSMPQAKVLELAAGGWKTHSTSISPCSLIRRGVVRTGSSVIVNWLLKDWQSKSWDMLKAQTIVIRWLSSTIH